MTARKGKIREMCHGFSIAGLYNLNRNEHIRFGWIKILSGSFYADSNDIKSFEIICANITANAWRRRLKFWL